MTKVVKSHSLSGPVTQSLKSGDTVGVVLGWVVHGLRCPVSIDLILYVQYV